MEKMCAPVAERTNKPFVVAKVNNPRPNVWPANDKPKAGTVEKRVDKNYQLVVYRTRRVVSILLPAATTYCGGRVVVSAEGLLENNQFADKLRSGVQ